MTSTHAVWEGDFYIPTHLCFYDNIKAIKYRVLVATLCIFVYISYNPALIFLYELGDQLLLFAQDSFHFYLSLHNY